MADFTKHRREARSFSVDFSADVNEGDAVDAVSEILVTKRVSQAWTDVSAEFGSPSGTEVDDVVSFTLGAGGATQQDAGLYQIQVRVTTTGGETLVATPTLEVTEFADPDAP